MSEYETPEFRTRIGEDGSIRIPASYLAQHGFTSGANVSVRVTELVLTDAMRKKGITDAEVDAIGSTQLEAREDVLTFLSAEGSLSGSADLAGRIRRDRSAAE